MEETTPGDMIRKEIKRDKLKGRVGKRAWEYKKKLEEGGSSNLARKCLEEMKENSRLRKTESSWERGEILSRTEGLI